MEDLISVIVPVYNVEKYINRCIDSIINQTYKNLEIILVDDGSQDSSGQICDDYSKKDSRIKVIHKENNGVSSARNTGLDNVTGEWIAFIDADDWIEKNYCEMLINEKQKDIDIIGCGYKRVNGNSVKRINYDNKTIMFDNIEFINKLLNVQNGYGFVHTKLYRRSLIGNIRFDVKLRVAEDALFNIQIASNTNKIKIINHDLYDYRINTNSAVRLYDEKYDEKYLSAMRKCSLYINENYSNNIEIMSNLNNFIAYHILLIAVNYCYNTQNPAKNKQLLLKDICNKELFKKAIKESNYNELSATRKITLFTLKHNLYILTGMICRIRQIQLRGK